MRQGLCAHAHANPSSQSLGSGSSSLSVNASSVYADAERLDATLSSSEQASADPIPEKELSRRQKISRANKGKVPWNKGKVMTEAMKQKISQRTYEAMQRPDVRERMKMANANRAPHSDEVRKRIREVLRKRAEDAKKVIGEQSALIVAALAASSDSEERDIASRRDAHEVIGKLAWRMLHRDFEEMYDKWEDNEDGFRLAVKDRFRELKERKVRERSGRRKARASGSGDGSVRRSVGSPKASAKTAPAADAGDTAASVGSRLTSSGSGASVLSQAEEKIESVSKALSKLRGMKKAYKDDPDSLQLVEEKEKQTAEMLERLQSQVELLRLGGASTGASSNSSNSTGASSSSSNNTGASSMLPWQHGGSRATR